MNPLTPRSIELLEILQEECAEVIQAISKIKRFGLDAYNPADETETPNSLHLLNEIGDVVGMVQMFVDEQSDNHEMSEALWAIIEDFATKKREKVQRFLNT